MSEANFGHFWHIWPLEKNNKYRNKNRPMQFDRKKNDLPARQFWLWLDLAVAHEGQ